MDILLDNSSLPSFFSSNWSTLDAPPDPSPSPSSSPSPSNFSLRGEGCDYFNSSCLCHTEYQFYEWRERVLLGLLALPIIAFGLIANLTSVRIFTHRLMSLSSINWYLAVLSASDSLILISSFFVLSLPRAGEFLTWWRFNYISYSVTPYMYGMMMAAQTCSVWMTVGVSLHRYIGVCHPYKANNLLPNKRVATFISAIILFSCLFNMTRLFEVHVSNVCFRFNIEYELPSLAPTLMRINELYMTIFFGWAYTVVMFALPFSLLIILNTMVLLAVRKSRRMHALSSANDELSRRSERKERQTSIMLIAVVLLFLFCNSLAFLVNIMENFGIQTEFFKTLVMFSNFLVIINASCNICIYLLFSEKYRLLLQHYVLCECGNQADLLVNSVIAS